MSQLMFGYFVGIAAGFFLGLIAYAFLSSTSPEDDEYNPTPNPDPPPDMAEADGIGPFVLCAGCGRITPRDEQQRLCTRCTPPTDGNPR